MADRILTPAAHAQIREALQHPGEIGRVGNNLDAAIALLDSLPASESGEQVQADIPDDASPGVRKAIQRFNTALAVRPAPEVQALPLKLLAREPTQEMLHADLPRDVAGLLLPGWKYEVGSRRKQFRAMWDASQAPPARMLTQGEIDALRLALYQEYENAYGGKAHFPAKALHEAIQRAAFAINGIPLAAPEGDKS